MDYYLQHHGILGMHWGFRNGPPYPLGFGKHSASEKKAGWTKSLDGGSDPAKKKPAAPEASVGNQQQSREPSINMRGDVLKNARREDVHSLSNQQLREYNERLRLENDFKNLTEKKHEGKKYIKDLGKRAFEGIVVATAITIGANYVKKKLGDTAQNKYGEEWAKAVVGGQLFQKAKG